ncbi:MAG: hypothetical protein KAS23_10535 [Anaerohalosphaera sp.]|nr:hypothetical protein [Anaerohalosphaera sp.]
MLAITVSTILERAEEFEERLSQFYKRYSHHTQRASIGLLADHISRHSHHIREYLSKLDDPEKRHICSVQVPYEPTMPDCRCIERSELAFDASVDEVIGAAMQFDEYLLQMYRQVVQQPVAQEVKALFESLIQNIEQEERELQKIREEDCF